MEIADHMAGFMQNYDRILPVRNKNDDQL